jgi:uncharacterized protein YceK
MVTMKKLGIMLVLLAGCSSIEKKPGAWEGGVEAKTKIEPTRPIDGRFEMTVSLKRKW